MKKNYLKSCLAALALLTAPLSLSALEKADGMYQIGTAADLIEFSNLVNGGEADASACLTADLDLSGAALEPIGTAASLCTFPWKTWGWSLQSKSPLPISDAAA